MISKTKWSLYPYYFSLRLRQTIKSKNRDWIFGRVACMGLDVYKLIGCQIPFYNTQKGRVDYLTDLQLNPKLRPKTSHLVNFMNREDILPLIAQQEVFEWEFLGIPKIIYMDSYSELTDQLFTNREKQWCFCANYTDLLHTPKFSDCFEPKGLISNDDIYNNYRKYFQLLRKQFPDTPIIFMHFPVKLDNREKFQIRYQSIKKAIDKITKEYHNMYSIAVDEKIVDWPEERVAGLENFPYHFNKHTYQVLAEQVSATGVFSKQ